MSLVFYTNPQSRGRIIRWMLEEVGQPYETKVLEYGTTMKDPQYVAINPMGKVPCIVDDGVVVTEAAAICAYLAEVNPLAELTPRSHAEKAAYYRWMFFAAGPVESAVTARVLKFDPPAEKSAMLGWGSYNDTINALEHAVSQNDYIAGHRFTAADVYVGSQVAWGLMFKTIEPREVFTRYVERLTSRDAYKRAAELDDALVEPQA